RPWNEAPVPDSRWSAETPTVPPAVRAISTNLASRAARLVAAGAGVRDTARSRISRESKGTSIGEGRGYDAGMANNLLQDGPSDAAATVALGHGAGAPMDSSFMNRVAGGLAARGLRVARFEFPYMARRRTEGKRSAPDREPVLRAAWIEV